MSPMNITLSPIPNGGCRSSHWSHQFDTGYLTYWTIQMLKSAFYCIGITKHLKNILNVKKNISIDNLPSCAASSIFSHFEVKTLSTCDGAAPYNFRTTGIKIINPTLKEDTKKLGAFQAHYRLRQ
jgi:hypothetical protein